MKKHFKTFGVLYCLLLTVFVALLVLAFCIPNESLRKNAVASVEQVMAEGMWFRPMDFYLFQVDNMTDCLMLNIAMSADAEHPVLSAFKNEYGIRLNQDSSYCSKVVESSLVVAHYGLNVSPAKSANGPVGASELGADCVDVRMNYGRYWHGYQAVLRPMLLFLDYSGIRVLNYFLLSALIVAVASLLCVRVSKFYGISFLVSLALINFPIVPLAMQFSTCFYVALLSMLFVLLKPSVVKDFTSANGLFFVVGACTSYLDFLTTPQLTLGLPLVVVLAISANGERLKRAFAHPFSWALGYALLWMSKWLVYRVATGESIMGSVATNAKLRTLGPVFQGGQEMSVGEVVLGVLSQIVDFVGLPMLVVGVGAAFAGVAWGIYKFRFRLRADLWLVVVIGIVPVWFAVLANHSIQHIFFTWRAWLLPLWAMMILACSLSKNHSE